VLAVPQDRDALSSERCPLRVQVRAPLTYLPLGAVLLTDTIGEMSSAVSRRRHSSGVHETPASLNTANMIHCRSLQAPGDPAVGSSHPAQQQADRRSVRRTMRWGYHLPGTIITTTTNKPPPPPPPCYISLSGHRRFYQRHLHGFRGRRQHTFCFLCKRAQVPSLQSVGKGTQDVLDHQHQKRVTQTQRNQTRHFSNPTRGRGGGVAWPKYPDPFPLQARPAAVR
jgi:hypothetical protein